LIPVEQTGVQSRKIIEDPDRIHSMEFEEAIEKT